MRFLREHGRVVLCSPAGRTSQGPGPRDQRKLLLQIEGRAKVYADHQIDFEHMAGVNFDL